ncbi:MAG: helix-turn-helix domain-containing protein [Clostridia bacterium]|nr:helix-turn-helix domain-containing protein [Clostridia bacterium]
MSNIKKRRKELGLTLAELAARVGLRDATIQRYESGEIPNIKKDTIMKLAKELKCTPGYLMGWTDLETVTSSADAFMKIPVLGLIPAGVPIEAVEDVLGYEEIPSSYCAGGEKYFALKLNGNSMYPEYHSGDIVILKQQETCNSNEDCAVMINGGDATFKRVVRQKNGIMLKPLNPNYDTLFYTNEEIEQLPVRIIGVFKELRRRSTN